MEHTSKNETSSEPVCSPKPNLDDRQLVDREQAVVLSDTFQELANETRLRILHALHRNGKLSVGDVSDCVGMKPQAVSNQLRRMNDRGIVESKRDGNKRIYRITDPCIPDLIDRCWCLYEDRNPGEPS